MSRSKQLKKVPVKKSKEELSAIAQKAVTVRRKNDPTWGQKKVDNLLKKEDREKVKGGKVGQKK